LQCSINALMSLFKVGKATRLLIPGPYNHKLQG
jgi:hypothetical protein